MLKIGTEAADGDWDVSIDANALEINSNVEISKALATEIRIGTPISQIKGAVISYLPTEGSSVDLSYEGQTFTAKIIDEEVVFSGPENNRIRGRFHGTSNLDPDAISTSQSGTA